MNVERITQFTILTIVLSVILGGVIAAALRVSITDNWDDLRCDSYVIPIAGFFKPSTDSRTATQFATDNFNFCRKQFVQNAVRIAAEAPKALADAEAATAGVMQDIASTVADVFFDLWKMCYATYIGFMDKMKIVAKLFHNFMINLYSITERMNAAALSIIYGLIALILTTINAVQVALIVAIIVIGIIIVLQIVLFYLLMPISGLIIMVTALVSVVVVAVATAVAAAMVAELFSPGACFATGTLVRMQNGSAKRIETIQLGDIVYGGGRVTACHSFISSEPLYDLSGIRVTGDHLVYVDSVRVPVREHTGATRLNAEYGSRTPHTPRVLNSALRLNSTGYDLWCLTTTSRKIPCVPPRSQDDVILFADWEEIDDDDEGALDAWYRTVWSILNPTVPVEEPRNGCLSSEAGLAPDTLIACQTLWGATVYKRIADIRIGDRIYDGPTSTTVVTGTVQLEGDYTTDAMTLQSDEGTHLVTSATWVRSHATWRMATGTDHAVHPIRWNHLYTSSGQFYLRGGWYVRDASDVGLANLRPLVDAIVQNDSGCID